MLSYELLPECLGLRLIGALSDFYELRDVMFDVARRSPLIDNKDETHFLDLAYDLRKAYDRNLGGADTDRDMAADVNWLCLLVTSRVLRDSLAFMDHGKRHQAMTYALEAAIHDGLRDAFGEKSGDILDAWYRLSGNDFTLLDRCADTVPVFESWSEVMRRKSFAEMIGRLGADWITSPHLVVVE